MRAPDRLAAFIVAFVVFLIGIAFGWFIQYNASRLKYNGEWQNVPRSKKHALAWTGGIAAFAGAWVLGAAPSYANERLLFKLWFWQGGAALAGNQFLDLIVDRFKKAATS